MRGSTESLPDYWTEAEKEWNRDVEKFIDTHSQNEFSANEPVIFQPFPICVRRSSSLAMCLQATSLAHGKP